MKAFKKVSFVNLGSISSVGSNNNFDFFHIFSENTFFEYDIVQKMNKFISKSDNDFGISIEHYNLKKRLILSQYRDMNLLGNSIYIKMAKIPNFGEGILCVPAIERAGNENWMTTAFFEYFIKLEKSKNYIDIKDKKICFGFIDLYDELDMASLHDFFKVKNKKNIDQFKSFMSKVYKEIPKKRFSRGERILSHKVPNGRYELYSMVLIKSPPLLIDLDGSPVNKGMWVGDFIKLK